MRVDEYYDGLMDRITAAKTDLGLKNVYRHPDLSIVKPSKCPALFGEVESARMPNSVDDEFGVVLFLVVNIPKAGAGYNYTTARRNVSGIVWGLRDFLWEAAGLYEYAPDDLVSRVMVSERSVGRFYVAEMKLTVNT